MPPPAKIDVPIVAVINASEDTVDALTVFFQQQGFRTASKIWPAREPLDRDLALAFMSQHQPHVVVFDISFPYDRNYQRFREFQEIGDECRVPVVLTTTNNDALSELVGPTSAMEIVGKPYDLEQLLAAVRRALASTGSGS